MRLTHRHTCTMRCKHADSITAVTSQDANLQFEGVHYIRRLLSKEDDPPTEAVLSTGVLPYLVSFLDSENSRMQFESCWAITNIASTVHTKKVVDAGAVPKLGTCIVSAEAKPKFREEC